MPNINSIGKNTLIPLGKFKFAEIGVFNGFATLFITFTGLVYFLFQKKWLPRRYSRIVSKLLFYPTLPITLLMRLGNYWTVVDDTVFLGCAPIDALGVPDSIHRLGVRGVINMCAEYSGPTDKYSQLGIKQLRLPTDDHYEPALADMVSAMEFISECKSKNEKVYIHCKAGHGRAACIAFCWLMHQQPDADPKLINSALRSKRKVRKTLYKQTNVQKFIEFLRGNKDNCDIQLNNSKEDKKIS